MAYNKDDKPVWLATPTLTPVYASPSDQIVKRPNDPTADSWSELGKLKEPATLGIKLATIYQQPLGWEWNLVGEFSSLVCM